MTIKEWNDATLVDTDSVATSSWVNMATTINSKIGNLVEDLTPELGGNLIVGTHAVGSATNADLIKLHAITVASSDLNSVTSKIGNVSEDTSPSLGGDLVVGSFDVGDATASDLTKLHGISVASSDLNTITSKIGNIVEDTTPQLGGNLDWNAKGIILAGQVIGSGVSDSNCIYWDGDSWEQADADQATTCDGILAMSLGSSSVLTDGIFTTTGLTAGDTYYVSVTSGGITNSAPSSTGDIVRVIGMALSTTQLLFKPSQTYLELA